MHSHIHALDLAIPTMHLHNPHPKDATDTILVALAHVLNTDRVKIGVSFKAHGGTPVGVASDDTSVNTHDPSVILLNKLG